MTEAMPKTDSARSETVRIAIASAALTACFAVTLFTNGLLLRALRVALGKGPDWPVHLPMVATAGDYAAQYKLASIKDAIFFFSLLVLGFLLRQGVAPLWPQLKRARLWLDILVGFALASVFIYLFVPAAMGHNYAELSVEPFLAEPSFYYRRILMPVLAHDLHLGGALYALFFWAVFALVCALTHLYLAGKGVLLSRLELASLFTTGMFATSMGLPGYGEILVLGLTLIAVMAFERDGRAGIVQLICFGLALLTHESAALLAFGAFGLCLFGPRFLLLAGALLGVYLFLFWLSFGLDASTALGTQVSGGDIRALFPRSPLRIAFSVITGWKLGLVAAAFAAARAIAQRDYRPAGIIILALAGGVAMCALATDYIRIIGFGTFGLLVALSRTLPLLSDRQRKWLAAINLLLPSLYVAARSGVHAYGGLYGLALRHWVP